MAIQFPPEVIGEAAGVLVYILICLLASVALFTLTWVHGERTSYVSILALASMINAITSAARLINSVVNWRDIHDDMYWNAVREYEQIMPALVVFGNQTGAQLVLFSIQLFALNIESMVIACWAIDLTIAVYQVRLSPSSHRLADTIAKSATVILPAIQIGLLHVRAIQGNAPLFYFLANCIIGLGMVTGSILMGPLLCRYIRSKRQVSAVQAGSGSITKLNSDKQYDKWLVIRFAFAFFIFMAFEASNIYYQINNAKILEYVPLVIKIGPLPLTVEWARADITSFLIAVTGNIVNFIIFGTTSAYRDYMWRKLVPIKIQKKWSEHRKSQATRATQSFTPSSRYGGRGASQQDSEDFLPLHESRSRPEVEDIDSIILQRVEDAKLRGVQNHAPPWRTRASFDTRDRPGLV